MIIYMFWIRTRTRLEGSKTNCGVSVTSRKPAARFRVDEAGPLAEMEEPSHRRRPGIGSSAVHQAEINGTGG